MTKISLKQNKNKIIIRNFTTTSSFQKPPKNHKITLFKVKLLCVKIQNVILILIIFKRNFYLVQILILRFRSDLTQKFPFFGNL